MADTTCPDCAVEMDQIERTTFTGRDMREYQCPKCGRKEIIDCGKALWQILSDADENQVKTSPLPSPDSCISRSFAAKTFLAAY